MIDPLRTAYRTLAAGDLRASHVGREVRLAGWVHRRRDLGGLVFVDLRDREGIAQLSFDPAWTPPGVLAAARALSPEDVIQVEGRVERRVEGQVNARMPTGEVELRGISLNVLARAEPLPIPVYRAPEEELPAEELRLRHRSLELRRPEVQRNLRLRHRAAQTVRRFLAEQGFLEVETPLLTKPTPEGARDFLVPSRVHPGEFYALPQSPQLYKQLLMVSGLDRYFQIARCLRDEDLRADRQPEFTQIDAEMAFVDEEDVFGVAEGMLAALWRDVLGVELTLPFPRLAFAEALERYGTDKPDLRFGLPILDLTTTLQRAPFRVFEATRGTAERIRGIRLPDGARLSRRELDELQDVARRGGALGVLWVKRGADGLSGSFAKTLEGEVLAEFLVRSGMEPGDLFVAVAGPFRSAGADPDAAGVGLEPALDELRRHLARKLERVDAGQHAWVWVTEFPLFDWDAETDHLASAHHPFTAPHPDDVERLLAAVPGPAAISREAARDLYLRPIRSRAYDAVYNGNELASGSVRIHDPELQRAVLRALGIGPEEASAKFGFLLDAFRFGAPPHAGFAFGFDRLVMLLAGATSLREVIAFPKTTSARAAFEGAPTQVADQDLAALHIRSRPE